MDRGKTIVVAPRHIVAVDDVEAFIAPAFARPQDWIGRAIELAGDDLTAQRAPKRDV
ncbi:hypothetical protein N5079_09575 [Planotetraspora sp. A-T 1434]|uniref:hypothetical protein n=1 Tax=Planotetraspora sp. A-T 1434 TaxID=2979219 RepID=UPI0021C22C10|nr:hypothetical protein [Planotetraspora sp. A-T 1434]MCT9930465.1 hypothetical protein [Planotetraspora sp. A-T 1434]